MKKHVRQLVSHPLISGSSIIFIGSFGINILNYLFNLIMGRFLSVENYGILISLIALVTLLSLTQTALTNLFAKFAASYIAKDDKNAQAHLVWMGSKITFIIACVFLVVLLSLTVPLSNFLHIKNLHLIGVVFLSVIISVLSSLPSGMMQGGLKFLYISIFGIIGAAGKIGLGVGLVVLGWGVFGAISGVFFSFLIPYILSLVYVVKKYKILVNDSTNVNFLAEFKKISGQFLLASIAITVLQGTDVIFARHFLSSLDAGLFAALSLMGRAIFYITSPIYFVFFPIIAHKKEKKEKTFGTLFLASGIIFLCSTMFSIIYFAFPSYVIKIFFPSPQYQALIPYLGFYSLYILVFSFAFLLNSFFLSLGKVGIYKINLAIAVLYVVLLFIFHANITDFISVLTVSSLLLLVSLLVYYWRYESN